MPLNRISNLEYVAIQILRCRWGGIVVRWLLHPTIILRKKRLDKRIQKIIIVLILAPR